MGFKQEQLVKVDNQSRNIFDTYIYKTEDTCADVQSAGYFDASRYAKTEPQKWFNGIIEIKCSDGFGKGFLDGNGDFSFLIGGGVVPPAFCAAPAFVELAATNASASYSGIEITSTRTAPTDTSQSFTVSADAATVFVSNSSIVQQNFVFKSKISNAVDFDNGGIFGVILVFVDSITFLPVCELMLVLRTYSTIVTDGAIVDSLGGFTVDDVLHNNLTISANYEISLAIDTGIGAASYKDNEGRSGSLKFSGSWNPANPLFGAMQFATAVEQGDQIVGDFNQGSQAFGVTIPSAVAWCEAV